MAKLLDIIEALAVKRYHTLRTQRTQTVAEHSAIVAAFVLYFEPNAPLRLLRAALLHDTEEIVTGDVPAPAKWNHPLLKCELAHVAREHYTRNPHLDPRIAELTDDERNVLHFCDLLEGALWCSDEYHMGNSHAVPVLRRYVGALADLAGTMPPRFQQSLIDLNLMEVCHAN